MAGKVAKRVAEAGSRPEKPAQRLCNEIQLFDLCELEKCGHKNGLYCTSTELLNSFEAISEEDERPAVEGFISEGLDDDEGTDDDGYDDAFNDENDDENDDECRDDSGYEEDE